MRGYKYIRRVKSVWFNFFHAPLEMSHEMVAACREGEK